MYPSALDRRVLPVVALSVTLAVPSVATAQGTPADYARAEKLRTTYESLVVDIAGPPTAIGNTHRFWYRKMVRGAEQFVVVDADTQQRQPAFDHEKIAASLSKAAGTTYKATALPFNTLTFTDDGSAITVNVEGSPYRCSVADATCRKLDTPLRAGAGLGVGRRRQDDGPRVSPDGKWEALINNFNIAIRAAGTRTATRLSTDGSEGNAYELSSIAWSPDSKKVAAYRVKPGYRRQVHYVESSPEDQLQPKHTSILYAKPGDVLDVEQPVLFLLDSKRQIVVDNALFPNAYAMSELVWRKDSRAFTFEYNQRGHQIYRVVEVDGTTGSARAVISEEPKTFFTYRTANGGLADSGKEFRYQRQLGGAGRAARGPGSAPDLVQRRRNVSGEGSLFRRLLSNQLRRIGPHPPDRGGRQSRGGLHERHEVLRRYLLADRHAARHGAAPDRRQRARDNPRARRHHRAGQGGVEASGGVRRQRTRRHDRHLGHHHQAKPFRPVEEVSRHREHLRGAARLVRAEVVLRLQPDAVASRARVHRRAD